MACVVLIARLDGRPGAVIEFGWPALALALIALNLIQFAAVTQMWWQWRPDPEVA